jgi:hypothetical protein
VRLAVAPLRREQMEEIYRLAGALESFAVGDLALMTFVSATDALESYNESKSPSRWKRRNARPITTRCLAFIGHFIANWSGTWRAPKPLRFCKLYAYSWTATSGFTRP